MKLSVDPALVALFATKEEGYTAKVVSVNHVVVKLQLEKSVVAEINHDAGGTHGLKSGDTIHIDKEFSVTGVVKAEKPPKPAARQAKEGSMPRTAQRSFR